jgi:transposase
MDVVIPAKVGYAASSSTLLGGLLVTRRQRDPLRPLTGDEREWLLRVARSRAEPASHVARAEALLAVDDGGSYTDAAKAAGRRSGEAVSRLVSRFNREGIAAIEARHGGGPPIVFYAEAERERILAEARRKPELERDGAANWSLATLRRALREAPDGLPGVGTHTIWKVLEGAGFDWRKDRSWCETGVVERKRGGEVVAVVDPDARAKKVDRARLHGGRGLGSGGVDRGRGGAVPDGALSRRELGARRGAEAEAARVRAPGDGQALDVVPSGHRRGQGARGYADDQRDPPSLAQGGVGGHRGGFARAGGAVSDPEENLAEWKSWQEGLSVRITLPEELPPLRMLLVRDNLVGHLNAELLLWMFSKGIMVLYTPLGGGWLNMAESIQRILVRRALRGEHPRYPEEIIERLEGAARGWNRDPTPFEWGGRRAERRARARKRRHALGGSGACVRRPIRRRVGIMEKWRYAGQTTH